MSGGNQKKKTEKKQKLECQAVRPFIMLHAICIFICSGQERKTDGRTKTNTTVAAITVKEANAI